MKDYEHEPEIRRPSDRAEATLPFEAEFEGVRRDQSEDCRDLHDPRRYWHMIFGGTD